MATATDHNRLTAEICGMLAERIRDDGWTVLEVKDVLADVLADLPHHVAKEDAE